jgi:hypothetical protein
VARPLRLFTKKRGHRHTGSQTLASAGEILFFGFLFIMGAVFLTLLLAKLVIPEWRANHEFGEATAVVLAKHVEESIDSDQNLVYRPRVKIRYQVENQTYETSTYDVTGSFTSGREDKQALLDKLEVGREYKCWYDPLNPSQAVLVRGYSWWFWLLLLAPVGFMLIGAGRLIYALWQWGKSPERRAAQGQPARLDLFDELDAQTKLLPSVPRDDNITNSPGTHLKYRLPINASQGWRLFAATLTCLFWNAIVVLFAVIAIRNHLRGEPDWWLDLFVLPFLAAGGFLIYFFIRELLIATGVGPTTLEISDHPLMPGRSYDLYFSQTGHLTMNRFEISLECEESATYRQGTDARTERRTVVRRCAFEQREFEVLPGASYESHCRFEVPTGVMHSFRSNHNEVQWKLVVRGDVAGWPSFERSFPVVVLPSGDLQSAAEDQSTAELAGQHSF